MAVSGFIRILFDRKRQFHHRSFALPSSVEHASHEWIVKIAERGRPASTRADHSTADFFRIAKWKNGVGRPVQYGVTSRVYVAVQRRMQHRCNDKGTRASAAALIALTYSSRSVRSLSRIYCPFGLWLLRPSSPPPLPPPPPLPSLYLFYLRSSSSLDRDWIPS